MARAAAADMYADLFTDDPEQTGKLSAATLAEAARLLNPPAELPTGRNAPPPESMNDEARRKRRIELAEEEERARLRVRDEWERERRGAAPAEAHQGRAAPTKPERETQAGRIARYVRECEHRAAELGETFDRERMPGTKTDFLDLLHALDAALRSIKSVESLDRYLKGVGCKWPLDASAQPSAAPLYASLFPEAHIRAPGSVSLQRRKA